MQPLKATDLMNNMKRWWRAITFIINAIILWDYFIIIYFIELIYFIN